MILHDLHSNLKILIIKKCRNYIKSGIYNSHHNCLIFRRWFFFFLTIEKWIIQTWPSGSGVNEHFWIEVSVRFVNNSTHSAAVLCYNPNSLHFQSNRTSHVHVINESTKKMYLVFSYNWFSLNIDKRSNNKLWFNN